MNLKPIVLEDMAGYTYKQPWDYNADPYQNPWSYLLPKFFVRYEDYYVSVTSENNELFFNGELPLAVKDIVNTAYKRNLGTIKMEYTHVVAMSALPKSLQTVILAGRKFDLEFVYKDAVKKTIVNGFEEGQITLCLPEDMHLDLVSYLDLDTPTFNSTEETMIPIDDSCHIIVVQPVADGFIFFFHDLNES